MTIPPGWIFITAIAVSASLAFCVAASGQDRVLPPRTLGPAMPGADTRQQPQGDPGFTDEMARNYGLRALDKCERAEVNLEMAGWLFDCGCIQRKVEAWYMQERRDADMSAANWQASRACPAGREKLRTYAQIDCDGYNDPFDPAPFQPTPRCECTAGVFADRYLALPVQARGKNDVTRQLKARASAECSLAEQAKAREGQ